MIRDQLPDLRVEIVPGTPPQSRALALDITRAETLLGWKPEFGIEEAFADYIAEMKLQMG